MALSFLPEEEQEIALTQKKWEAPVGYNVQINTTMYLPQKSTTNIRYKATVVCDKNEDTQQVFYTIDRTTPVVNNKPPKDGFEELTYTISSVFNTIKLQVGVTGKPIALINYKALQNKWSAIKNKLQKEYTGASVTNYILATHQKIMREDVLFQNLLNDPFLMVFFGGYYTNIAEKQKLVTSQNHIAGIDIQYAIKDTPSQKDASLVAISRLGTAQFSNQDYKMLQKYCKRKGIAIENSTKAQMHAILNGTSMIHQQTGEIHTIQSNQQFTVATKLLKEVQLHIKKN
ncbi:hypothetical protein [Aquimarina sp. I32.4]|uniref:hypothetical protein n=1 Tax=Aquimarina sp. I32.4 TaxID=2053903 RepID=UPI000CDE953C|nr:hypothetical protein [Aquimarina sp. I32.4]